MRAGKDAVLFRLANVAYSCGLTPNVVTELGLGFTIRHRQHPSFVAAGALGLTSTVQIIATLLQKKAWQNNKR
jgi:hypothetical protein